MKLLQWNIWYKEKIENIAQVIRDLDPDIACLQEIAINSDVNQGIHTAEYLRDTLNMKMFYKDAQVWDSGKHTLSEIGNVILSKLPIAGGHYCMLQQSEKNSDDYLKEGRVYIEAYIKVNSNYLTVGTTHLSYTHEFRETHQKLESVEIFKNHLKRNPSHFVVTGDFNVTPDSNSIAGISQMLEHAGPNYQEPTWTTKPFQYENFQCNELKYRLDYVFTTKDIAVRSARIVQTQYSDHLPILVEFDMT